MITRRGALAALSLTLALAAAGPALASGGGNGSPPGAPPNAHGLCTAADNGAKNGKPWQNGTPGPWQNLHNSYLESAANEGSNDTEGTRANVVQDCQSAGVPISGQGHP